MGQFPGREDGFSIHDLTEMKALERSLRHSERIVFLGHLVDDNRHQIRNPVTVIGGFARRLECNASSSKKVRGPYWGKPAGWNNSWTA